MGSAATHRPVTDHCMSVQYGIAKNQMIRITSTLRAGNLIRLMQYFGWIPSDSELPTPFCIA